jgi:hypothetical protein
MIGIYFGKRTGEPDRVLKIPLGANAVRHLTREAELLRELETRDIRVGPRSIKNGEIQYQPEHSPDPRHFCYFLQEYLTGSLPGVIDIQAFITFLNKLIIPGSVITLTEIAARLKERLDKLNINQTSKQKLLSMLTSVTHHGSLPASIQHGDLSPRNLFQQPSGDYLAVDWELACRPSFGFLDLLGLRLRKNFLDRDIVSFTQIYAEHCNALEAVLPVFFPNEQPQLHEPLALQFCQYYIDRAESYSELAEPVLQRLDSILLSKWITE